MKTEQTLRYWLEQLKEPYRSKALKNAEVDIDLLTDLSISEAIKGSFAWVDSPEEHLYWSHKYHELKEKGL